MSSFPLLFTVVIDIFSYMLEQEVSKKFFTHFVHGSCSVSHLLFADDLLVMKYLKSHMAYSLNRTSRTLAS